MKGIVFQGFLELVENEFGLEMADAIIEECDLASGGAYTSVGSYDYREIVAMAGLLSERSGVPVADLVRIFGKYLFSYLASRHPRLIAEHDNSFSMLEAIERDIHREVRKLYPDAELPHFDCQRPSADTLVMHYRSSRPLADVAHGLIEGCALHYSENINVVREDIPSDIETRATFTIERLN